MVEEESMGEAEPWEPIETKLVVYSLIIGTVAIVVLGVLVNKFILSQY
jgi:hypothetical protein